MLVLLPPSETKSDGGDGAALRLDALAHADALGPTRDRLVGELVALAADPDAACAALGITARQAPTELARNAALRTAPTAPALTRYTGVLYDALDIATLSRAQRARAGARLVVVSALFGLLGADDPIPAYRLSGGSTLPSGTVRSAWRPVLPPVLADLDDLVVDLRSGPYAALAPAPGAVVVRVLCVHPDGRRSTISHFNKAHKGALARLLVTAPREVSTVDGVARVARRGGLTVEHSADHALDVLIPA